MARKPVDPEYESDFARAIHLRDAEDLKGAEEILRTLVQRDPNQVAGWMVLGHVLWKSGDFEAAAEAFRAAVQLAPRMEMASLGLFHMLWKMERLEEALQEIRRFNSAGGESQDYRDIVAEILAKWSDVPPQEDD
jgi:cytochrome c-type biogenesis protein CcmH/NrfG